MPRVARVGDDHGLHEVSLRRRSRTASTAPIYIGTAYLSHAGDIPSHHGVREDGAVMCPASRRRWTRPRTTIAAGEPGDAKPRNVHDVSATTATTVRPAWMRRTWYPRQRQWFVSTRRDPKADHPRHAIDERQLTRWNHYQVITAKSKAVTSSPVACGRRSSRSTSTPTRRTRTIPQTSAGWCAFNERGEPGIGDPDYIEHRVRPATRSRSRRGGKHIDVETRAFRPATTTRRPNRRPPGSAATWCSACAAGAVTIAHTRSCSTSTARCSGCSRPTLA